jgi:hypothetical protein
MYRSTVLYLCYLIFFFLIFCRRTSFLCELDGDHVEEFRNLIKSSCDGLPILVLQFVELTMSQGIGSYFSILLLYIIEMFLVIIF